MLKNFNKYLLKKKNWQKFLFLALISFGLLAAGYALAQDYGMDAVSAGLDGSLGEANQDPRETAGRIINFALGFLGIIALLVIIYAGFKWMTSGGDESKIAEAKKTLIAAVIGLVIILSSWGIATFLISEFAGVISGNEPPGNNDGDIQNCGCGGYMVYNDGAWGPCIGTDCSGCVGPDCGPTTCDDSSFLAGCQANDNICADNNYCADDCTCQPKAGAGESCNLSEDQGVCSPDNNLCGSYLTCDPTSCLCVGSPVITGISPLGGFCENNHNSSCKSDADCSGSSCNLVVPNGAINNFLTIFGKNFGEYVEGQSRVVFVGSGAEREAFKPSQINPSCINSWSDDEIIVAVPNGASTGAIRVESDGLSDYTNDDYGPQIPDFVVNGIVRPGLCEISPSQGLVTTEVNYKGVNLRLGDAYFGNYTSNVPGLESNFSNPDGLSGLAKTPNIQSGRTGSFVEVEINGSKEKSNYLSFIKEKEAGEGPFISSFSPSSGNVGQYVTIFGSGFGSAKGAKQVYFGSVEADYDFPDVCLNSVWSNDQITVKVPGGLDNGDYPISIVLDSATIDTQEVNPNTFEFDKNLSLKTSLCKINPIRGPSESEIGIWGEYFGNAGSDAIVKFNAANNISVTVKKDGRADYVETTVPQDAITGPVRVIKGGEYGNELNFSVGACSSNDDCGSQVCCPNSTYKSGQCASTLLECYVDIPSSVFEWTFNTGFDDESNSCAGLAAFYGACFTGNCPNVPGTCSPYAGGEKIYSKNCSLDCSTVSGCEDGSCSYDANLDRCISTSCDLNKTLTFTINEEEQDFQAYCNDNGKWEFKFNATCPEGYVKGFNNTCFDPNSSCSICNLGLSCSSINNTGRCVAPKTCPSGSVCEATGNADEYKCASETEASCDCCCTIGQSARDCCAFEDPNGGGLVQLQCGGTCGSDTSDPSSGLGKCSGCAAAGSTAEARDLACNCTGSSGQYCEVNDSSFPSGYCTDCSSLSPDSCMEHSDVCCLDSKGTADSADDVCRGGAGDEITTDTSSPDFGYCAYYECDNNANTCSAFPVKIGSFYNITKCNSACGSEDPCTGLGDDASACTSEPSGKCCFDGKNDTCILATAGITAIDGGADDGYCAYYNCSVADPLICASGIPLTNGAYNVLANCEAGCANPGSGEEICGCTNDSDCSSIASHGCANDTCCKLRPEVTESSPKHLSTGVCRNAIISVSFNQLMNYETATNNILLLEEKEAGNFCPSGTAIAEADLPEYLLQPRSLWVKIKDSFKSAFVKIASALSDSYAKRALANPPSASKLYCSVPGSLSIENQASSSIISFWPTKVLEAATDYYLLVKGDEELNSQTGIMAISGVGLNGEGYLEPDGSYIEGAGLTFNGVSFKNSEIIKFSTLSSQGANAGVCLVDYVSISPASYLFNVTENALPSIENDIAAESNKSFDTVADSDKVFTLKAVSADGQYLQPITGYYWDYIFSLSNGSSFTGQTNKTDTTLSKLPNNQYFVRVKSNVTDAEGTLTGKIDMDRFASTASCNANTNCVCTDTCPEKCCNMSLGGDDFNDVADVYAFTCNNPWPEKNFDGSWYPWQDNPLNCSIGNAASCISYNYKFYYCRDAGSDETYDDLPAILNTPLSINNTNTSNALVCSTDNNYECSSVGALCGADNNADGRADGICMWSVLKESYFFRETLPSEGAITNISDMRVGGTFFIEWNSRSINLSSYKIYYVKQGSSDVKSIEINPSQANPDYYNCGLSGGSYYCRLSFSGLEENNVPYEIRVTAVSNKGAENQIDEDRIIKVTDTRAPIAPYNFSRDFNQYNQTIQFSWNENNFNPYPYPGKEVPKYAKSMRLYIGNTPGAYLETITFDYDEGFPVFTIDQFLDGDNYIVITAIDEAGNESSKSNEVHFNNKMTKVSDNIPRIMYWSGKVNQHVDLEKQMWLSDPDGVSGAGINQLTYCNKFYPGTIAVELYKTETIYTWENVDLNMNYPGTRQSYRCLFATE